MQKRMRRQAVIGAAAAFAAAPAVCARGRAAQFEYKSAHVQAVETPMHVWLVRLWDQVAKETNGRLVVKVFPAGQLGGQGALLSQVRAGAIQFVSMGNGIYASVVPAAGIDSVGFAFKDPRQPWAVMAGPLGDYVRAQFESKGLVVPKGALLDQGMCQVTSSSKPIRTVDDFAGFKLRVPPGNILVDLFRSLGAAPVPLDGPELYPALQSHLVDGQENIVLAIQAFKLYEVQKYVSIVNALWTGAWYVGNLDAWKALPADIQEIATRNIVKYCAFQRSDSLLINTTTADKLRRYGMIFNTADTSGMRARLGPYYARWKNEFGPTLWGMLESSVGKLS